MQTVTLNTSSMQGIITVGKGCVESRLPKLMQGQKNFALVDENVLEKHADLLTSYFSGEELFILPSGEKNKSFQKLGKILNAMSERGLHRTSRLFAIGGGVVGDIGGLAAALYMRGISCVQIPTTLLAQVDSSVGGKTAVNMRGMKNIVGAFYQPCEVLVDPLFLRTLPEREIKCGLGEIVKYAALNEDIFHTLYGKSDREMINPAFLDTLVLPCIQHKARVVAADERENGERKSLNIGHTTGHAVELSSKLSHGESVLLGMLLETKLAIAEGVCEKAYGEKLLSIVKNALAVQPLQPFAYTRIGALASKAKSDKKNADDKNIVLSLPVALGKWTAYSMPFEQYKRALLQAAQTL